MTPTPASVIGLGAMGSALARAFLRGPTLDWPVGSPLALQAAAFGNLIDSAHDAAIKADLLTPLDRLIEEAVAMGHGEHDFAAVAQALKA